MKVIHITPPKKDVEPRENRYKIVTLLANRISQNNHFALIQMDDGTKRMTGGYIISNTPEIRQALNNIPFNKQYEFVHEFKQDPFVRSYWTEPFGNLPAEKLEG